MRTMSSILAATLLFAACSTETPPQRKLAFLLGQDTTRAYVLDSKFSTDDWGLPTLDPPYEAGLNQLTILRDVGTDRMAVERTIPLGLEGWLCVFALSPDGDTAVLGRVAPNEVLVVRGLSGASPYLAHSLPLPEMPSAVAVSPDGSWALVGSQEPPPGPAGPLKLFVVADLPDEPRLSAEIDLGPDEEIDCGNVTSVRITDNGRRAIVISGWGRDHSPIPDEMSLMLIGEPGPGGAQQITEKLPLPLDPAIPPPDEFVGLKVGVASGNFEVLCDGDSLVVPMMGLVDMGVVDARILLINGLRAGRLDIVRILGPDDGVDITPMTVRRLPDCDSVVLTHIFVPTFTVLTGMSDPSFQSVRLETFTGIIAMNSMDITPDGQTLVVSSPRAPVDNRPPAHVTNYRHGIDRIDAISEPLYGPVRFPPFFRDAGIKTMRPGLADYVRERTTPIPAPSVEALESKIEQAVDLADLGLESASVEVLQSFRWDVDELVAEEVLPPERAAILQTLAQLAEERLR